MRFEFEHLKSYDDGALLAELRRAAVLVSQNCSVTDTKDVP